MMPATRRAALIGGAALVTGASAMANEPQATALEGTYHPANVRQNSGIEGVAGVSIRMECAMRAMQALISGEPGMRLSKDAVVKRAFEYSDAMIAKEKEGK